MTQNPAAQNPAAQNAAEGAPIERMAAMHVCFSGSLACSGCNPCPECRQMTQDRVLPAAMMAAGMHELSGVLFDLSTTLHALVTALQARGIDPQTHLGVPLPRDLPGPIRPEVIARAFFQGYVEGWKKLHAAMHSEELAGRYAVTNVSEILSRVTAAPPGFAPEPAAPPAAPSAPRVDLPSPDAPARSTLAAPSAVPVASPPEARRVAPARRSRPMTAAEIVASAAVPAPQIVERESSSALVMSAAATPLEEESPAAAPLAIATSNGAAHAL